MNSQTKIKVTSALSQTSERTINWFGNVTYANMEKTWEEIRNLQTASDDEITLLVSSPGGATGIAMSFFDTVRYVLKPKLVTIGSGDVDSSGIILFLCGEKRYLTRNTTLLLHLAGRTFASDTRFSTAEMETMLKEDKLKDYQYASVVSERSGKLSTAQVMKMMAENTILTPEEAVHFGLAHGVLS